MYEFPTSGPITANIRINAGAAIIVAEDRADATIEVVPYDASDGSREAAAQTRVEFNGDTLHVEQPPGGGWLWRRGWRIRITARVPLDSRLNLRSAAAEVGVDGQWSEASLNTASGNVRFDRATGAVAANSASGRLEIRHVGQALKANTASGNIEIGSIGGDAVLHSASGHIRIANADSSVTARTASGDVDLRQARSGEVRAQTASGDVTVGVAPGTAVKLDVLTASGSTHSDLAIADAPPLTTKATDLNVVVRTASGNISVVRAIGAKPSYT